MTATAAVAAVAPTDIAHRVRVANAAIASATDSLVALGAPPPQEALTALQSLKGEAALFKELKTVVDALRGIGGVNARAFEELRGLEGTLDALLEQHRKLDDEKAIVQNMIETLDQQRDHALDATYTNVKNAFGTCFEQLAGADAKGSLEVDYKLDDATMRRVPVGARMNVRFGHGDSGRLSGGQATIASLALMFAIQQCDPAPFYLFDEIDAALDRDVRDRVAQLIAAKASAGAQILTVTHRPELVYAADSVYFVTYQRRESGIRRAAAADAARALELGEARSRATGTSRRGTATNATSTVADNDDHSDSDHDPSVAAGRRKRPRHG